jgi:hypothetical protein
MLQRIQFTVKNYKSLQGLILALIGIAFLVDLLWRAWLLWIIFPKGLDETGVLLELLFMGVMAGGATWIALVYYRRTFGLVDTPDPREPITLKVSGWVAVCVVLIFVGLWLDLGVHPHVSFLALALAATMVIRWYCLGRRLHYYLVLAALLLGVSFLPFLPAVYQIFEQSKSDQFSYLLTGLTGCLLIAVGLCDHIALLLNLRKVRTMMYTGLKKAEQ